MPRIPRVTAAPMSPTSRPSKMNGQRMNGSEAPTRRMISISWARDMTAMRMVLTTMSSTVSPTRPTTPRPMVRRTPVIATSRSITRLLSR